MQIEFISTYLLYLNLRAEEDRKSRELMRSGLEVQRKEECVYGE